MTMFKPSGNAAICGLVLAMISASALVAETPASAPEPAPAPAPNGGTGAIAGERFGAWLLACPSSSQAKAACFLLQNVSEALSPTIRNYGDVFLFTRLG